MSGIILPGTPSWWETLRPRAHEMPEFLKLAGAGWRTPKRQWEQLWRERRGEFNHILGRRTFRFGWPRRQRGVLHPAGFWFSAGGDNPSVSDITHTYTVAAPNSQHLRFYYHTNGYMEWIEFSGLINNGSFSTLTTGTDDANDHTNEWWPDQPSTEEGLNWDLRYLSASETDGGGGTNFVYFDDGTGNRVSGTWYLLDTVYDDTVGNNQLGNIGLSRGNGTAKAPATGTSALTVDVELGATGSGTAVASHSYDLTLTAT